MSPALRRLHQALTIQIASQPDAFVVCDKGKLIDEGVFEAWGVREYWIVNPETLEVFIYAYKKGAYGLPSVADLREPVAVSIFPGLSLKVRPEDL